MLKMLQTTCKCSSINSHYKAWINVAGRTLKTKYWISSFIFKMLSMETSGKDSRNQINLRQQEEVGVIR